MRPSEIAARGRKSTGESFCFMALAFFAFAKIIKIVSGLFARRHSAARFDARRRCDAASRAFAVSAGASRAAYTLDCNFNDVPSRRRRSSARIFAHNRARRSVDYGRLANKSRQQVSGGGGCRSTAVSSRAPLLDRRCCGRRSRRRAV